MNIDPHIHAAVECILLSVIMLIGLMGWQAAADHRAAQQRPERQQPRDRGER